MAPTITTASISNITAISALSGGEISSDGGSAVTTRGVCWSTNQAPTISDNKTIDGTGTGIFTSSITGLAPDRTYYIRAYATNSTGTAYGNQLILTTSSGFIEFQNKKYPLSKGYNVWLSELDCGNFDVFAYGIYLTDGIGLTKFGDDVNGKSIAMAGMGNICCFNLFCKNSVLQSGTYTFVDSVYCSNYKFDNKIFTVGSTDKLVACDREMVDPTNFAIGVDLTLGWDKIMQGNDPTADDLAKLNVYLQKQIRFKSGVLTILKIGTTYEISFQCKTKNGESVNGNFSGSLTPIEFGI